MVRLAPRLAAAASLAAFSACTATDAARATLAQEDAPAIAPLAEGESGLALFVDRLVPCDDAGSLHAPGLVVVRDGVIEYAGAPIELPDGFPAERVAGWAVPGQVDLHSHVVTDGWGGINDMVLPVNAGLSTRPTIRAGNQQIKLACASGVTTLFLIPGSGTSISGFGVLLKTRTESDYRRAVLADPGGMKVAQTHNPERRGGDVGVTRAGLYWLLEESNERARAQLARGADGAPRDFDLANLERVHAGDLPVLIHCAGNDGVEKVVRMWKEQYGTRCVISHGSFDGWTVAAYVAEQGVPVNHGPRTFDYPYTRTGRVTGSAAEFVAAGVPDFSLNTDAPVIPAHELFLQGSMSARHGADGYAMLRALTIHPARSFGIDDRVGSLEAGKHADVVVYSGDPLDPRSRVELVLIEGEEQYRRRTGEQWF